MLMPSHYQKYSMILRLLSPTWGQSLHEAISQSLLLHVRTCIYVHDCSSCARKVITRTYLGLPYEYKHHTDSSTGRNTIQYTHEGYQHRYQHMYMYVYMYIE